MWIPNQNTDASAARLCKSDRSRMIWSESVPHIWLCVDGRRDIEEQQLSSSVARVGVALRNAHRAFVNPCRGKPPIGEPDAGDPPVRFGGRGTGTQSCLPTPIVHLDDFMCKARRGIRPSGTSIINH